MNKADHVAAAGAVLRPMVVADLPKIVEIEQAVHHHPWSQILFERELENAVAWQWVCECAGEIVGYLCVWQVASEIEIHNIATAPNWQRRGIGGHLLHRLIERARRSDVSDLFLEVRQSNRAAVSLYEKFGFKQIDCRRGYYHDGEDALLMSCSLS